MSPPPAAVRVFTGVAKSAVEHGLYGSTYSIRSGHRLCDTATQGLLVHGVGDRCPEIRPNVLVTVPLVARIGQKVEASWSMPVRRHGTASAGVGVSTISCVGSLTPAAGGGVHANQRAPSGRVAA